jgi:hypothetical protein
MGSGRLALLCHLPADVVAKRALGLVRRKSGATIQRLLDRHRTTYCGDPPEGKLQRLIAALPLEPIRAARSWIAPAASLYCRHFFDLLGSGWVKVEHGMMCRGLDGFRYDSEPRPRIDPEGAWLAGRLPTAGLSASQHLWRLIPPGYTPIDWQRDFKSGFRWRESRWAADTALGHLPGVDVKVPWELARMQHLPILAWAHALAAKGETGLAPAEQYCAEFRNQVLDFIATNPPRFGVNWRCTMDVAIRAVNWVVAYDLFRAGGGDFDPPFAAALKSSLVDHGRHIVANLEIFPEGRGNHYLANICGLAFIAASLPRAQESDAWLAFAIQELIAESEHQFGRDGANFEGSTSYHRLSAEMVIFTTALIRGLPEERLAGIRGADAMLLRTRPRRPLRAVRKLPDHRHLARIAAMAEFSRAVTKPSGRVVQIGDNDSGRFLKLHPIFSAHTPAEARLVFGNLDLYTGLGEDEIYLDEEMLDHRPTIAAAAMLVARPELGAFAGHGWLDAAFVGALAKSPPVTVDAAPRSAPPTDAGIAADPAPCREIEIISTGTDLRAGLVLEAYADFGLWIFRSNRLFLAIRCGSLGQHGRGAHDHNDQLAIELTIDGVDWIADPGSYVYTADRAIRNAYRSVAAHCAPRWDEREPGRLDLGDFWLGDEAQARCLRFDAAGFIGEHRGFGRIVRRHVTIGETTVTLRDCGLPVPEGEERVHCVGHRSVLARFPAAVPFSAGYGKRYRNPPLPTR